MCLACTNAVSYPPQGGAVGGRCLYEALPGLRGDYASVSGGLSARGSNIPIHRWRRLAVVAAALGAAPRDAKVLLAVALRLDPWTIHRLDRGSRWRGRPGSNR